MLKLKESQLQDVLGLQKIETSKPKLEDLYKKEVEIIAQISILRYLLSKRM